MEAAPPPGEPDVEVTVSMTDSEFGALERLARRLETSPARALREALGSAVIIRGLIAEGCTILYRRPDGATGEIEF